MIKVALDAMGGDNAPDEIVAGAILARKCVNTDITLVGDKSRISALLERFDSPYSFPVVHASEVVDMNELPSEALRKKKDASIFIATKLVAEGKCDAVVSAGSTGAQMAGALFILGRIKGVDRPAITTVFPTINGKYCLLSDSGAVPDAKPRNLMDFARLSSAYCRIAYGIEEPRVGLVNIGEEAEKGSELTKATHQLLTKSELNFVGNVEPSNLLKGDADVFVCDGFTGNVVLKCIEGISSDLMGLLKDSISSSFTSKIGGLLIKRSINKIKGMLDYSEYGGAPLLGVNGLSIISHGRSNRKAIASAIKLAVTCAKNKLNQNLTQAMQ